MKRKMSNYRFRLIVIPPVCILLIVCLSFTIFAESYRNILTSYMGQSTTKLVELGESEQIDSMYYKSAYASEEERDAALDALSETVEGEGMVLLKNENAVLPLGEKQKVSLFSVSSQDIVCCGSGAGSVEIDENLTLKHAFEEAGYTVNPVLWDFYTLQDYQYGRTVGGAGDTNADKIGEVPVSVYTNDVISSFSDYHDAAIVVLSRQVGEASDVMLYSSETGGHFFRLSTEEEEMIDLVTSRFDKVILLLNTPAPFELGDLATNEKIQACLWIGYVGQAGMYAVPKVFTGEINPSGRLVDTYAADLTSAPAYANLACGQYETDYVFQNRQGHYDVYAEGIYVGYRYYETRYEDAVTEVSHAGDYVYADEVLYPFGYGLSYTQFTYSDVTFAYRNQTFYLTMNVTNTGAYAGKEVVQIYFQSPYTEYDKKNLIEKSSVELCGFAKTGLLQPGESEEVVVSVPLTELKTYDSYGIGTYLLEEGTYYFTVAGNAHEAVNQILVAKGTEESRLTGAYYAGRTFSYQVLEADTKIFATDDATGAAVTNRFSDVDLKTWDSSFRYLSRSDWTGTWPKLYKNGSWTIGEDLISAISRNTYEEDPNAVMPVTGADNDITLISLRGADYNDANWDLLLDNLTVADMIKTTSLAGWVTPEIEHIGKPATEDKDGPAGLTSTIVGGKVDSVVYPCEVVVASTWNMDLAEEMGKGIGEDGLKNDVEGWYAPGANIHRSPFGGRNFEYYSEDPFLSGTLCASEVKGVQSMGMYAYVKHFALNDTETWRYGKSEFVNEQAFREIYLSVFEKAVKSGGARGIMTAFNCIGTTWCSASKALCTDVLRTEWGFCGTVITDTVMYTYYTYYDAALYAGTDLLLNTRTDRYSLEDAEDNPHYVTLLRNAMHNVLYTVVNSAAMNGITQTTKIVSVVPAWEIGMIVIDVIAGLLALASVIFIIWRARDEKKYPNRYRTSR